MSMSFLCLFFMCVFFVFLSRVTRPISHHVRRSVGRSVGHIFTFSMRMAFIAPAKLIIAPALLITAPAQVITAPA